MFHLLQKTVIAAVGIVVAIMELKMFHLSKQTANHKMKENPTLIKINFAFLQLLKTQNLD